MFAQYAEIKLTDEQKLTEQHKKWLMTAGKLPTDDSYLTTTERSNPLTIHLSQDAQMNLPKAIDSLKQVDLLALSKLATYKADFAFFKKEAIKALKGGNSIFISGCGAAGRAAILICNQIKETFSEYKLANHVIPIIAGGDASLVRAAEGFEDNAEYGKKQLIQMGWKKGDLFVGLSASGSATFIHAQLEHAVETGQKPFLFFCNTQEEIKNSLSEKKIFKDKKLYDSIYFISTMVNEMGLSGSTRMQAATAQIFLAVSLMDAFSELTYGTKIDNFIAFIQTMQLMLKTNDLSVLQSIIKKEAEIYERKNHVIYYIAPMKYAQNILTDTTERSPTFMLPYFENRLDAYEFKRDNASLVRLIVDEAKNSEEAWHMMLKRPLIALNWPSVPHTHANRIYGYDLSREYIDSRRKYLPETQFHEFFITVTNNKLQFKLDSMAITFDLKEINNLPLYLQELALQIFLKMVLNIHSTLVMGVRNLYYSNQMIYVRPSNLKLINRAARGVHQMLYDIKGPIGREFPLAVFLMLNTNKSHDFDSLLMFFIMNKLYEKIILLQARQSVVLDISRELANNIQLKYVENNFRESDQATKSFLSNNSMFLPRKRTFSCIADDAKSGRNKRFTNN